MSNYAQVLENGDTEDLLLSRADEALYQAKNGGRDRALYATHAGIG